MRNRSTNPMFRRNKLAIPISERTAGILRTLLIIVLFPILTHVGLAFQDELASLVKHLALPHSSLLTDQQVIYSIWLGLLGVHAAVGAVAPILGYTLLTTTITSASRVAPSGAVIAAEIRWRAYLQTSLALLAGSIVGIMSAPSAFGLALAGVSTVYVVIRTMLVFRAGFELIEKPEKFDSGARKYLAAAVDGLSGSPLDSQLTSALESFNSELATIRSSSRSTGRTAVLVLGDSLQATQLLQLKKGAFSQLLSEAKKLNLELQFVRQSCPEYLPRGESRFFQVSVSALEVKLGTDQAPRSPSDDVVDSLKLAQLQGVVSRVISYGSGPWIDKLVRAPMLVQRHVATVIYEAIPNQRPHDLEYGLDVLGSVIDSAGEDAASAGSMNQINAYHWVLEVPQFVLGQIEREPSERLSYARKLAGFLRARLIKWFERPALDWLSKVYISQIVRLFSIAVRESVKSGESFAPIVREITFLDRLGRKEVVVLVEREIILLLVPHVVGEGFGQAERRLLIKTMVDVLKYSRTSHLHELHVETCMGALAVSLFCANSGSQVAETIVDVIEVFENKLVNEVPVEVILKRISKMDEIAESWAWGLWELGQKESGEAHFMEMDGMLARGALLMLASRAWELRTVSDQDLPAEYVLDQLIKHIDAGDWFSTLPPKYSADLNRLKIELIALRDRRASIVARRVEKADLDLEKITDYVNSELNSAAAELAQYSEWISASCLVTEVDEVDFNRQFGTSSLIPRECFVPDEMLDVSVMMGNSGLGPAVQDFELRALVKVISESITNLSPDSESTGLWSHVAELISRQAPYIWLIGVGVSEYDVWEPLESARSEAKKSGLQIRFDNVGKNGTESLGVWAVDPKDHVEFRRYRADKLSVAFYERELPVSSARLYCGIAQISESMQLEWSNGEVEEAKELLIEKYRKSVLLRTAWSFAVNVNGGEVASFFGADELNKLS